MICIYVSLFDSLQIKENHRWQGPLPRSDACSRETDFNTCLLEVGTVPDRSGESQNTIGIWNWIPCEGTALHQFNCCRNCVSSLLFSLFLLVHWVMQICRERCSSTWTHFSLCITLLSSRSPKLREASEVSMCKMSTRNSCCHWGIRPFSPSRWSASEPLRQVALNIREENVAS